MHRILILDFGSQYTQLIARRVREAGVYSEIAPCTWSLAQVRVFAPRGIILSGGPASVHETGAPTIDAEIFALGVPVLGICYGMQLMAHTLGGGAVARGTHREYGRAQVEWCGDSPLTQGLTRSQPHSGVEGEAPRALPVEGATQAPGTVWMSHGDHVAKLPNNFSIIARSDRVAIAGMADVSRQLYALQFHPEVAHTAHGAQLIRNFLFAICHCTADWSMGSFIERSVAQIRAQVGAAQVVCGVSGGVDSSVVAVLLHRALGKQLHCIFVDTGLLRKNEAAKTPRLFLEHLGMTIHTAAAGDQFLNALTGVSDPETKRKIIGREFVTVFEAIAGTIPNVQFLAQGTLYPDVIESVSFKGPSATIKSHHNVGGLPEKMGLALVEPLRELFKDEVRALGRELGMPDELINRQPFPGPGLAVRIIGDITADRVALLQAADDVMMQEIKSAGWYDKVWQCFCVLLPVQTVGVMGDERTYENVVALRAVTSQDGMTADWAQLPYDLLGKISNRIINEVRGINRVVYDISSKPPATIEWE